MAENDTESVGARVARQRERRGFTQQGLALRAHVSKSLISKVETGAKPASPALIAAVARALRVSPTELLGQSYAEELRRDRMDALIEPIRTSMENWDMPLDWSVAPRPVALLHADVGHALVQRRQAEYLPMAHALPALIDEAVQAAHTVGGEQRRRVYGALAGTFRCAFTLAWAFGYGDLATVAADRLAWAAERAQEPALVGLHAYLRAQRTLASGRYDLSLAVVDRAVRDLDGVAAKRPAAVQAVVGSLHLRAAVIAGRAKDRQHADARLAEAAAMAGTTGELLDYGLTWGPVNVSVHAVAVASDLDEPGRAVALAEQVHLPRDWSRSRAGHHWIDLSRACTRVGRPEQALRCLQRARRLAPQQTRYHPTARETVLALRGQPVGLGDWLTDMGAWMGV